MRYEKQLFEKHVAEFIQKNGRVPSEYELGLLQNQYRAEYGDADKVGLSGHDVATPLYREASSASKENSNRESIIGDIKKISNDIDGLKDRLEDSFRAMKNSAVRHDKQLKDLESRVDVLLLRNSEQDLFLASVEENFNTGDKVDLSLSTAELVSGAVSIPTKHVNLIDLSGAHISSTITSAKKLLNTVNNSNVKRVFQEDGSFWENYIYSNSASGRVTLVVDIELPSPEEVSSIKLTLNPINTNSITTATVLYSTGGGFVACPEIKERPVDAGRLTGPVNVRKVRKIRVMLSKSAADVEGVEAGQWAYLFSIDNISLYRVGFKKDADFDLFCGPYPVVDYLGEPMGFSKAKLCACMTKPAHTSVDFYLSTDGDDWYAANPHDASSVVTFPTAPEANHVDYVDLGVHPKGVVERIEGADDLDFSREVALNKRIDLQTTETNVNSFVIKRGTNVGWRYNEERDVWYSTVYCGNQSGQKIQLGDTSCRINGHKATGEVKLPHGYHYVETPSGNFQELPLGLVSEEQLQEADTLYPYNHKYLFEGYAYADGFTGPRVYPGFDEHFTLLMQYKSPEKYSVLDLQEESLRYFTVEHLSDYLYVRMLTDKTRPDWADEQCDFTWISNEELNDMIYVRIVLRTAEEGVTPTVEDFKLRFI